jgi:general secretion pathway protein G
MRAAIAGAACACLLAFGCGGEERGEHTKAQVRRTQERLLTLGQALEVYSVDVGHYPTPEEGGLSALTAKPPFREETLAERWRGPYLSGEPIDAWGRRFEYGPLEPEAAKKIGVPYRLWSKGPDGKSDTPDDITNRRPPPSGSPPPGC